MSEEVAGLKVKQDYIDQSLIKAWDEINKLTSTMRDNMVSYLPAVEKANSAYASLIEMSKAVAELSIEMRAFHRRQDEIVAEFKRHDEEEMKKYDKILNMITLQNENHKIEIAKQAEKQELKDKAQDAKIDKQNTFRNRLIGGGFVVLFLLEQLVSRIWSE